MTSSIPRDPRHGPVPIIPGNLYAVAPHRDDGCKRYAVAMPPHHGDAEMAKPKTAYKSTAKKAAPAQKFNPGNLAKPFTAGKGKTKK